MKFDNYQNIVLPVNNVREKRKKYVLLRVGILTVESKRSSVASIITIISM